MPTGRLCQVAMHRQIRPGASMTDIQGQLRHPLSLHGMAMGPMTPKHVCSFPKIHSMLHMCMQGQQGSTGAFVSR